MSAATAKLKKQALQLEHDRQHDKALAIYSRLLDEPSPDGDEVDVALFNRAGDLALRVGDTARAVGYYERAVDLYAAGGLLNNAIALCNKVLRHAPDHVAAHYSLGVLHAKQGFKGDAKHHFVEYADRMHRAGRDDEAVRALREFADLCGAGDDVRAMLAQHLARSGKGGTASATLQAVFDAQAPAARPTAVTAGPAVPIIADVPGDRDAGALVFLDLSGTPALPDDDEPADEPAFEAPMAELSLSFELPDAPAASPAPIWEPASTVDGFEGTSWMESGEGTIGLPAPTETMVPAGPVLTFASALPGELPMLDLPLGVAAATVTATATLELEPELLDLDEPAAPAESGAGLTFLTVDADDGVDVVELDAPEAIAVVAEPEVAPPPRPAPAAAPAPAPARQASDFVDLGDWFREEESPRSTRMVTAEPSQTGDEEADFQRMLDAFKAGVERNIEDADFDSHYDLGVAFREMGLLEEAATQFQRASRAPGRPLRAIEALGECLIDLGHHELALEALRRGVEDGTGGATPLPDQQLVGVIYLLGVASEQTQRSDAACAYYRRVLATDLQFRDAARRLAQLSAPPR